MEHGCCPYAILSSITLSYWPVYFHFLCSSMVWLNEVSKPNSGHLRMRKNLHEMGRMRWRWLLCFRRGTVSAVVSMLKLERYIKSLTLHSSAGASIEFYIPGFLVGITTQTMMWKISYYIKPIKSTLAKSRALHRTAFYGRAAPAGVRCRCHSTPVQIVYVQHADRKWLYRIWLNVETPKHSQSFLCSVSLPHSVWSRRKPDSVRWCPEAMFRLFSRPHWAGRSVESALALTERSDLSR